MVEATARSRAEWGREPPAPKIRSKGPAGMDWDETPEGCLQLGFRLGSVVKTPLGCVVAGGPLQHLIPLPPRLGPGGRGGAGDRSCVAGVPDGPSRALLPPRSLPMRPGWRWLPFTHPVPSPAADAAADAGPPPGGGAGGGGGGGPIPTPARPGGGRGAHRPEGTPGPAHGGRTMFERRTWRGAPARPRPRPRGRDEEGYPAAPSFPGDTEKRARPVVLTGAAPNDPTRKRPAAGGRRGWWRR